MSTILILSKKYYLIYSQISKHFIKKMINKLDNIPFNKTDIRLIKLAIFTQAESNDVFTESSYICCPSSIIELYKIISSY